MRAPGGRGCGTAREGRGGTISWPPDGSGAQWGMETRQKIYRERFAGIDRLYGQGSALRFGQRHVAVVGLGGVGSWAVEAFARSGIGHLTLIDADDICLSNTNRQSHALDGQYGRGKGAAL